MEDGGWRMEDGGYIDFEYPRLDRIGCYMVAGVLTRTQPPSFQYPQSDRIGWCHGVHGGEAGRP